MNATARAHPSLALIKYWGKQSPGVNIPATSSLAVTLGDLTTETHCSTSQEMTTDSLTIDGTVQDPRRAAVFFDRVRAFLHDRGPGDPGCFAADSHNSFPTAAGLASSASGYAALTLGAVAAAGGPATDRAALSALAREGSGSAARSIFGGFTVWEAGAPAARELLPADWWPELRVIVLPISTGPKAISSRDAMNRTRDTSPFYPAWVADAPSLFTRACAALEARDLEQLGEMMRLSYLRMFGTMISTSPPVLYWLPETLAVLHHLQHLRTTGIPAWETMDAGPQVKVLTTAEHAARIVGETAGWCATAPIVSTVGPAAHVIAE